MPTPGKIVIISGLPGSGKSTLAYEIARQFEKGVHLEVDKLRAMVVNGVIDPAEIRGWSEELEAQFCLERQAAAQMASLYATQGFTVIIDDVIVPPYMLNHYTPHLPGIFSSRILLNPFIDEVIRRLQARKDRFDTTFIDSLPQFYHLLNASNLTDWTILDSTHLSQQETLSKALFIMEHDDQRK